MRIMIDTNIIISAVLFPNGSTAAALRKALLPPYDPIVCDYIIDELRRKFSEKFPDNIADLDAFLCSALESIEIINTPTKTSESEFFIRDKKDRPILRAAINAGADMLLTGDKDFLESAIQDPRIISVSDFLKI